MATNSPNSSQNAAQWNLCRFVRTLSYFGTVPLLSQFDWFQQWFGSRPRPTVDSSTLSSSDSLACHAVSTASGIEAMPSTHQIIFDFTAPVSNIADIWGALDDVVMGGVSQSGIQLGEAGLVFAGTVSTANSGGFASVRTRNFEPAIDLSAFAGIELRVKGDGQRYKFMLRSESRWDGIAHCYSFDTNPDVWMTIQIPFNAFIPVFRAKTVSNAPLAPSHIHAMQLMLSKFEYDGALNPKFEAGLFQLEISAILAYLP